MRYISTRSGSGSEAPPIGFLGAVLAGLAPDGGLYVPEVWPTFTASEIGEFAGKPYAEVAAAVLGKFAGEEIDPAALLAMCEEAYATFDHAAVTPVKQLSPSLFLLELFHGPTLAFKDVAMQLLGRLYDHALGRQGRTMTIIAATSGDTGGAAVEAFRGRSNARIVVLFPEGRISEVQRRFMTCADDANVRCVAVEGTFDDCQSIVKAAFQDDQFRRAVDLSGVNSINFARIAAQVVYYFTAGVALGAPQRSVSFAVPTGNFGDAFAGYVASRMGLPIESILVATNSNDIMARAFEEGRYARGEVAFTQSPAMDIQIASNFERLYFEAVGRDGVETARAFDEFARLGTLEIEESALGQMRALFSGASVSEAETAATIRAIREETGELIDPHTAVAVTAARRLETPMIALSTAHPAKFPEAVALAAGAIPTAPPHAKALAARPERFDRLPADGQAVKAYIREFARA
ncbi:MAG TPA: threonine synthase [Caulobacteraceae bacterium]|nr:threonine synthase [Caulobacteraceae bacterium]